MWNLKEERANNAEIARALWRRMEIHRAGNLMFHPSDLGDDVGDAPSVGSASPGASIQATRRRLAHGGRP